MTGVDAHDREFGPMNFQAAVKAAYKALLATRLGAARVAQQTGASGVAVEGGGSGRLYVDFQGSMYPRQLPAIEFKARTRGPDGRVLITRRVLYPGSGYFITGGKGPRIQICKHCYRIVATDFGALTVANGFCPSEASCRPSPGAVEGFMEAQVSVARVTAIGPKVADKVARLRSAVSAAVVAAQYDRRQEDPPPEVSRALRLHPWCKEYMAAVAGDSGKLRMPYAARAQGRGE